MKGAPADHLTTELRGNTASENGQQNLPVVTTLSLRPDREVVRDLPQLIRKFSDLASCQKAGVRDDIFVFKVEKPDLAKITCARVGNLDSHLSY